MNRATRISESSGVPPSSRALHRAPAAEAAPLSASAAFCHFTQGSAVVEARAAHNREVAGSTPAPATRSQGLVPAPGSVPAGCACDENPAFNPVAKTSEDNGATGKATMRRADCMTGEVSRVGAGRTASATSERMDATAGETAPNSQAVAQTVVLSDASAFILSLVSAHEGRAPQDILSILIAGAAEAIGIHSLIMRDAADIDLIDVPAYARRAANRFRGGGP